MFNVPKSVKKKVKYPFHTNRSTQHMVLAPIVLLTNRNTPWKKVCYLHLLQCFDNTRNVEC